MRSFPWEREAPWGTQFKIRLIMGAIALLLISAYACFTELRYLFAAKHAQAKIVSVQPSMGVQSSGVPWGWILGGLAIGVAAYKFGGRKR